MNYNTLLELVLKHTFPQHGKIIQNKINNFNRSITSFETEAVAKTLPTKEVRLKCLY